MKIKLNSVFVDDQEKALEFYTQVLGFLGADRWLTVVSPDVQAEDRGLKEYQFENDPEQARTIWKRVEQEI